jgi:protein TonB
MSRRVLIVDFDPENRRSTESLFADRGLEVLSAGSLAQLEQLLESSRPDVCLIEPALPGVDGFEVCKSIRDGNEAPRLIVASTNLRGNDAEAKARDAGAELYFERPIRDRELVEAVVEAVAELEAEESRQSASARLDEPQIPKADLKTASATGSVELAELEDAEFDGWLDDAFDALLPADESAAASERSKPESFRNAEEELLELASNLKPAQDTAEGRAEPARPSTAIAPDNSGQHRPASRATVDKPAETESSPEGTRKSAPRPTPQPTGANAVPVRKAEQTKPSTLSGPTKKPSPSVPVKRPDPVKAVEKSATVRREPAPSRQPGLPLPPASKAVEQVAELTRELMRDPERKPRPTKTQSDPRAIAQRSVATDTLRSPPLAADAQPIRGRMPIVVAGVAGAVVLAASIGFFTFRDSGAPEETSRATSSPAEAAETAPERSAVVPARPAFAGAVSPTPDSGTDVADARRTEDATPLAEKSPIDGDRRESMLDESDTSSPGRSQAPSSTTRDEPVLANVVAAGQPSEPAGQTGARTANPPVERSSAPKVSAPPPAETEPKPEPEAETVPPAAQLLATTGASDPATEPSTNPVAEMPEPEASSASTDSAPIDDGVATGAAAVQSPPPPIEQPDRPPVDEMGLETEPPPAAPAGPIRMETVDGSFDVEPRLIPKSRVSPRYPMAAQRLGVGGTVVLETMILADGSVGEIRIIQDPGAKAGLGKAAVAAVRKWRYEPAIRDGEPVAAPLRIQVSFKPR